MLAGLQRGLDGGEPLEQRVDELALLQDGVCAGLADGLVQDGVGIAGEGDQAEMRVVGPQPRDRRDAVEQRHVDVDHDRIR